MPRFIATHTFPSTYKEEDLIKAAKDMPSQLPPGVTWKQTWCDFTTGKFFCEWEAPSKETVEQIFNTIKLPYDAIYQVRLLDIATAQIEP